MKVVMKLQRAFMLLADAENRTKYFLNEQNHSQNALLSFVAFLCFSGLVFLLGFFWGGEKKGLY